jgi:tetratricopeptide (TPR) repeat protein
MGMLGLLGAASPETDHSLDSLDSLEALEARANAAPENARLQIALGAAYFTRGHTDAAKHAFFAATLATSDPGVAAIATYDLGVADLQGGDLEAARDAFFDALAIAPNAPVSRRARYNLEWTLRALSVRPPEEEHSEPVESSGFQTPTPNQDEEEQQEDERSRSGDEPGLPGSVSTPRRLSAMERERWLERIEDHTGEALRGGLGSTGLSPPKKAGEPAW